MKYVKTGLEYSPNSKFIAIQGDTYVQPDMLDEIANNTLFQEDSEDGVTQPYQSPIASGHSTETQTNNDNLNITMRKYQK